MKWKRIEVGIVLQGGGALGAYEWGAIQALFKLMDELEGVKPTSLQVVTGVSIGAINGACIASAKGGTEKERRQDGLARLAALWNELKLSTPFVRRIAFGGFGLPTFTPARDMSLLGLPGFYVPRMDFWNFWSWTSLYNTKMLEGTLKECVCFERLNAGEDRPTFVVTAVDVKEGTLRRFRNKPKPPRAEAKRTEEDDESVVFEPKHILASGSLAPQFPWTEVGDHLYWDGGLVDNTPLGDAIEAFSDDDEVYRLLIVMNLYPLTGKEPEDLLEVADRVHELSFGNRMRQDRASARRINALVRAVDGLAKVVKDAKLTLKKELRDDVTKARRYKIAKTVEIDLQTPGENQPARDDESGLRDFSPETITSRRKDGHRIAYAEIRRALVEEEILPSQPADAKRVTVSA